MKAIKLFLQKVWAIVSAIKPEEAMVSQPRAKSISPTTISEFISVRPRPDVLQVDSMDEVFKKLDHEGFFEALKQDMKGMQSPRCENHSSKSFFSFTDAEYANASASVLSKIDHQDKRLTVGEYNQEVAKEMVREKFKLSHALARSLNKYIKSGGKL